MLCLPPGVSCTKAALPRALPCMCTPTCQGRWPVTKPTVLARRLAYCAHPGHTLSLTELPCVQAHLEESVARHKQHIARMEQLLRLLDNEAVEPDDPELLNVKEMMEDYLDRNQEDFDSFDVSCAQGRPACTMRGLLDGCQ